MKFQLPRCIEDGREVKAILSRRRPERASLWLKVGPKLWRDVFFMVFLCFPFQKSSLLGVVFWILVDSFLVSAWEKEDPLGSAWKFRDAQKKMTIQTI